MDLTPYQNHPHDALFRKNFSHKEVLGEFLGHVLPKDILSTLDSESLNIENTSFVDEDHREHFSDISATVKLAGQKAQVYLLLEHKSYNDPIALLQILRYMQLKWNQEIEEAKGKKITLTPIIPILFHHGSSKNPPTRFTELFGKDLPESLKAYQPEFLTALYNLTTTPDEQLDASPGLAATLWALKYSRTDMEKILQAYSNLIKKYGRDFLEDADFLAVRFYILSVSNEKLEEIKKRYLDKINSPELKEAFMSTAEMLVQEGMQEGIQKGMQEGIQKGKQEGKQEGIQEGKIEAARKMFEEGLDLLMIARITGLPEDLLDKIKQGKA
jgi:predicted transposase/invertase (TIGR01784 family)